MSCISYINNYMYRQCTNHYTTEFSICMSLQQSLPNISTISTARQHTSTLYIATAAILSEKNARIRTHTHNIIKH